MKLRNLLITATLFCLSMTSAFAEVIEDGWLIFKDTTWDQSHEPTNSWSISVYTTQNSIQRTLETFTTAGTIKSVSYTYGLYSLDDPTKTWTLKTDGSRRVELPGDVGFWKTATATFENGATESITTYSTIGLGWDYGKINDYEVWVGGNYRDADITFGQPLPAPVTTLLIALALGAGFVMYRNRKQQAEA